MGFKLVSLLAACLAFLVPPAHSGSIGSIKSAALGTVQDLASIGTKVVTTKGAAMVKLATDIASIVATGMGLKVRALGRASSAITDAMADGAIGVGETISKAGNTLVAGKLSTNLGNTRLVVETPVIEEIKVKRPVVEEIRVETPIIEEVRVESPYIEEVVMQAPIVVEEDIIEPCEEEIIEIPVESYGPEWIEVGPEVVVEADLPYGSNRVSSAWNQWRNAAEVRVQDGQFFEIRGGMEPTVYEFVDTPRAYSGPLVELFQIKKK